MSSALKMIIIDNYSDYQTAIRTDLRRRNIGNIIYFTNLEKHSKLVVLCKQITKIMVESG